MNLISTAPLKNKIDFELFSEDHFNSITPFLDSDATALLLLDMISGSGQTSSLNYIEFRLSDDKYVLPENKKLVCIRISFIKNIGGDSWRDFLAKEVFEQLVSRKCIDLPERDGHAFKTDSKIGEFLVNTLWADIQKERIDAELIIKERERLKIPRIGDIYNLISESCLRIKLVLLIDDFDKIQPSEKNRVSQEIVYLQSHLQSVVIALALCLNDDSHNVDHHLDEHYSDLNNWREYLSRTGQFVLTNISLETKKHFEQQRESLHDIGIEINDRIAEKIQIEIGANHRQLKILTNRLRSYVSSFEPMWEKKDILVANERFLDEAMMKQSHFSRIAAVLLIEQKFSYFLSELRRGDFALLYEVVVELFRGYQPQIIKEKDQENILETANLDGNIPRGRVSKLSNTQFEDALSYTQDILGSENEYVNRMHSVWQFYHYLYLYFDTKNVEDRVYAQPAYEYWHANEQYRVYMSKVDKILSANQGEVRPQLLQDFHKLLEDARARATLAVNILSGANEVNATDGGGAESELSIPEFSLTKLFLSYFDTTNNQEEKTNFITEFKSKDSLDSLDKEYLEPLLLAHCSLLLIRLDLIENKLHESEAYFQASYDLLSKFSGLQDQARSNIDDHQKYIVEKATYNKAIFVSYQNNVKDKYLAEKLVAKLRNKGVNNVFIDEDVIRDGDWAKILWTNLKESASYLIVCSREYMEPKIAREVNSESDRDKSPHKEKDDNWCWAEAAYAKSAYHRYNSPIYWIPVYDGSVNGELNKFLTSEFNWLSRLQSLNPIPMVPINEAQNLHIAHEKHKEKQNAETEKYERLNQMKKIKSAIELRNLNENKRSNFFEKVRGNFSNTETDPKIRDLRSELEKLENQSESQLHIAPPEDYLSNFCYEDHLDRQDISNYIEKTVETVIESLKEKDII